MCGQESLEFLTTMEKWRRKMSKTSKKKERNRQTTKESLDKNGLVQNSNRGRRNRGNIS